MNFNVVVDWKLVVALGGVAVAVIFALKLDSAATKEVSIHAIDACEECLIAQSSNH